MWVARALKDARQKTGKSEKGFKLVSLDEVLTKSKDKYGDLFNKETGEWSSAPSRVTDPTDIGSSTFIRPLEDLMQKEERSVFQTFLDFYFNPENHGLSISLRDDAVTKATMARRYAIVRILASHIDKGGARHINRRTALRTPEWYEEAIMAGEGSIDPGTKQPFKEYPIVPL